MKRYDGDPSVRRIMVQPHLLPSPHLSCPPHTMVCDFQEAKMLDLDHNVWLFIRRVVKSHQAAQYTDERPRSGHENREEGNGTVPKRSHVVTEVKAPGPRAICASSLSDAPVVPNSKPDL